MTQRSPRYRTLFLLLLACWLLAIPSVQAQGPIAYYPFNGNANDASGNGHNGTVTGATLTIDRFGRTASAYSFDGDDFIQVSHSPALVFGRNDNFTLNAWVRMCQTQSEFAGIVVKGPTNTYRPGYQLVIRSSNKASSVISNNDGNWTGVRGRTGLDGCCWHFITLVVSPPTSSVRLYVDGILDDSATSSIIEPDYLDQQNPLFIGKERNSSVFFRGDIDDIRIYNRMLAKREIDSLYRLENWSGASDSTTVTEVHICDEYPIKIGPVDPLLPPYRWNTGATTEEITITADGTYWIRGTRPGGCPRIDTFHVKATILPPPTVTSVLACSGVPATLVSSGLRAPFLWSTGATSESLVVGTSGTYWVTGTYEGGCTRTDTFHVTAGVSPPSKVTTMQACAGNSKILSAGDLKPPYLWSTGARSQTIEVRESGSYWVSGSVGAECPRIDTIHVVFEAPSPIDAGSKISICRGDTVRLQATGAGGYRWDPHPSLSCTDCASPLASPAVTTSYIVTSTDAVTCPGRDTVQVIVYSAIPPDAGPDRTICPGDTIALQSNGGDGTYRWDADPGLSCTDCRNPRVAPSASTRYIVTVTTANGCKASDTVNVVVAAPAVASAGRDTAICTNGSVQLDASGGVRYQWSPAEGLSCDNCANPVASPLRSTRYRVTVWNAAGCAAFDEVDVEIVVPPVVRLTGDTVICRGSTLQLEAGGGTSYRWMPHPDLSCLDCPNPAATPSAETTTYYLTVANNAGCETIDSVTVRVNEGPALILEGDSTVCRGTPAHISVSGAVSYRWWFSAGSPGCPTCEEQSIVPDGPTTLWVEGRDVQGCVTIDSFTVSVANQPELVIRGGGAICPGESLTLHASGATSYRWEPREGLSCSDCADPVASPSETTTYRVTGIHANGCMDSSSATVELRLPVTAVAMLPAETSLSIGKVTGISVTLDQELTADTLTFDIVWRRGLFALQNVEPSAALRNDGWTQEILSAEGDRYNSRFIRSRPGLLSAGPLIDLTLVGYLGDTTRTDLPFTLLANSSCATLESRPGHVTIDSICGLELRLITVSGGKLRLDSPAPNPVIGTAVIRYAIPFAADDIDLTLIDAAGRTTVIRSGYHAEGEHEASLDGTVISSGVHTLRLRVGEMSRQIQLVVIR
jgi:hypothetical protein